MHELLIWPGRRRRRPALVALATMLGSLALQGCMSKPALAPDDLTVHRPPRTGAAGIEVTWMGVTTLVLSDGETTLLSDGYFTRPGNLSADALIGPDRGVIAATLERLGVDSAAAVMVVHSHFDHAMDAPIVAELTGATLLGSESTANVGRGLSLPEEQIRVVVPGEPMPYGRFTVTFFESRHWPLPEPWASAILNQTIDAPLVPPARLDAYKDGESYTILIEHDVANLLIQGSAGYLPGALQGVRADVVFLGTGGLGRLPAAEQDAYFREIVGVTGAKMIYPVHWDALTTPPGAKLRPASDFEQSMNVLYAKKRATGIDFGLLPLAEPVLIEP